MRRLRIAAVILGSLSALVGAGQVMAEANNENASCMGLGSSFYALFAAGQRADVALIVKSDISEVPGEHYQIFAREKEGGWLPSPCGTRIE
jgi:hypothetical protein